MAFNFDEFRKSMVGDFNAAMQALWVVKNDNDDIDLERLEKRLDRLRDKLIILVCLESKGEDKFEAIKDIEVLPVDENDLEE